MSETKYLKCPCRKCGEPIEFPAHGIGAAVNCPHCGEKTTLFAPPIEVTPESPPTDTDSTAGVSAIPEFFAETPSAPSESAEPLAGVDPQRRGANRPGKLVWVSLIVLGAAALMGALFYQNRRPQPVTPQVDNAKALPRRSAAPVSTNIPTPPSDAPATARAPKSVKDLNVGTIALEKSKGSSLVYAVGVLKNDSEYQRFGVTIELALSDARGNKAGTAKDYRAVIEPHQEWRFRALVLDSKAASAQVERVREEE